MSKIKEVKPLHMGHYHVTLEDGSMDTVTREEVAEHGKPEVGQEYIALPDPRASRHGHGKMPEVNVVTEQKEAPAEQFEELELSPVQEESNALDAQASEAPAIESQSPVEQPAGQDEVGTSQQPEDGSQEEAQLSPEEE